MADRPGLRRVEQIMGTAISIDLATDLPRAELERLCEAAFDWFREVDARFSTYIVDSEVNRLSRGELPEAQYSPQLQHVLDASARLWRETEGYFDAYATGRFDPSAYVKGWSAQVASDRLAAAGVTDHCVNAGGDVRVRGEREPGQAWRIGIRHPWQPHRLAWVLTGTDLAIATSGTYERGLHVVDPYSGERVTALRSVTVVGTDLGVADAYSTAAMAMGERGRSWLATLTGHESAVVTEDGRAFRSDGLPTVSADPVAADLSEPQDSTEILIP